MCWVWSNVVVSHLHASPHSLTVRAVLNSLPHRNTNSELSTSHAPLPYTGKRLGRGLGMRETGEGCRDEGEGKKERGEGKRDEGEGRGETVYKIPSHTPTLHPAHTGHR